MTTEHTTDLWLMAERMAEDLQDYVDEGERGGSDMAATKNLLQEFEELRRRAGRSWLDHINDEEVPEGIAAL